MTATKAINTTIFLLIVWLCGFCIIQPAFAQFPQNQITQDYIIASQLLRQGQYDKALEILEALVKENPTNFPYVEAYIQALSQVKKFDQAITIVDSFLAQFPNDITMTVRKAQLHHTAGDSLKAYSTWDRAISMEPNNPNVIRIVAESLQERREFDRAVKTLQNARTNLNDPSLFVFELANINLVAGRYAAAAREYNSILLLYPDRLQFIQRQYSRFNDMELVDAAIVEADESIRKLTPGDERIAMMREFQIWLLIERGLFRRAIAIARNVDVEVGQQSMLLFNVAQRLAGQNEFELSEQALKVYVDQKMHPLSARSAEELGGIYMRWARYLITNNLDSGEKIDEIYKKTDLLLRTAREEFPAYPRRTQLVLIQIELALDYLKDVEIARVWLSDIKQFAEAAEFANEIQYLEGRILLFEKNFNEARVLLTRSNTASRIGDLAEKTRYFLALTDFFSKEYEFAGIQLKALERQNASLYANDALQLRLWIMEGRNKDSTTTEIDLYSSALLAFTRSESDRAAEISRELVRNHPQHALADDALLLLSRTMRYDDPVDALRLIDQHIRISKAQNLTEQLLWERILLTMRLRKDPDRLKKELLERPSTPLVQNVTEEQSSSRSLSVDDTLNLLTDGGFTAILEDILIRYPQGFYSANTREQLRNLKQNF